MASYIATSARRTSDVTSVAVVGAERDADRGAELHGHAAHDERALQRVQQPAGELGRGGAIGQVVQQHGELVAAEPREHVAPAQRVAQAVRDVAQEPVAVVVAERVVDLLEAVEVDQQQAGEPAEHADRAADPAHALVEARAVGEAGERVVERLLAQLARGAGDEREEREPQQPEPAEQERVERDRVLVERGRDRRVVEVELDDALDRAGRRRRGAAGYRARASA